LPVTKGDLNVINHHPAALVGQKTSEITQFNTSRKLKMKMGAGYEHFLWRFRDSHADVIRHSGRRENPLYVRLGLLFSFSPASDTFAVENKQVASKWSHIKANSQYRR